MDNLHTMLRAIRPASASPETKSVPAHLVVFREFLDHLARLQRKAPVKRKLSPKRRPTRR